VRIAVTGSTGMLGSQVVDLLATTGLGTHDGPEDAPHEVLALARRPGAVLAALSPAARASGVVVPVHADYDDAGSLHAALRAGSGRVALVSRADVGRCLAALALLPPSGRHHDLTGPEALTFEGLAGVLTGIAGIPVSYTDVPARVLVEELARSGEDPWWTYAYSTMFASVREDRWGTVSGEVLGLTGRAPSSVVEVLRHAA